MRQRLIPLLLVAATCAAAAPTAGAEPADALTASRAIDAPRLAGERLVVAAPVGRASQHLVSLPPTGVRSVLARVRTDEAVLYDASAERVAAVRLRYGTDHVERVELLAGPPEGPLATVTACENSDAAVVEPAVAEGSATIAAPTCARDRVLVVTADGTQRTLEAGGTVARLAAGGRYVAWLASSAGAPRLTVYDVEAGATAYTAEVPGTHTPLGLALAEDGTAVVGSHAAPSAGFSGPCGALPAARFAWHSVLDPSRHEIPGLEACNPTVRLAGGRVAVVRLAQDAGERELVTSDLAGMLVRVHARYERLWEPSGAIDWDGARSAWSETRCRDFAVRVRSALDASAAPAPVSCPVAVSSARLRGGRAHVRIACRNGCRTGRGDGVEIISPRWLHVRGRRNGVTLYGPRLRYDLRPGERATLRLPLTAHQRRLALRRGRVELRIKVTGQHVYQPRMRRTLHAR